MTDKGAEKLPTNWYVYHGGGYRTSEEDVQAWLDQPPPWRRAAMRWDDRPDCVEREAPQPEPDSAEERRGRFYVSTNGERELQRINMALQLRRPLLVRGKPGLGKSSVAYSIAWSLGLGEVLRWEIGSRTALQDGLYEYDAVSHLHATRDNPKALIDDFITLGPLGTALLPTRKPRVLLVDELDKASYDLPNDLLHVFEEGNFVVRPLLRRGGEARVLPFDHGRPRLKSDESESTHQSRVVAADKEAFREPGSEDRVSIHQGRVCTHNHPIVIITTNDEREFNEAFCRRCVTLDLRRSDDPVVLGEVVRNWFGRDQDVAELISAYPKENTDVLLQALFLERTLGAPRDAVQEGLLRAASDPE